MPSTDNLTLHKVMRWSDGECREYLEYDLYRKVNGVLPVILFPYNKGNAGPTGPDGIVHSEVVSASDSAPDANAIGGRMTSIRRMPCTE